VRALADSRPIDRWLDAYEAAWATGIGVSDLFSPDARYFIAPFRPPIIGPDAIERWWISQGESDTRWTFEREVIAIDGSLHVVQGRTTYPDTTDLAGEPQVYYNLWLITLLESGRASEFVEYWMLPE
jgi:hypothetical protein